MALYLEGVIAGLGGAEGSVQGTLGLNCTEQGFLLGETSRLASRLQQIVHHLD